VIGAVGIVVTLLNVPTILDAAGRVGAGEGLPPEFEGAGGMVRVFTTAFAFVVFTFLICLGLAVTLSSLASALGAPFPMLTSSLFVAGLLSLAVTVTLALYRSPFFVAAFVGTLLAFLLGSVAAVERELNVFWATFTLGLIAFLITGFGTLFAAGHIKDDGRPG
jgi:hypothetical protein